MYVLADGMGGAKAGERASRLAVETVSESILAAASRDSQALLVAVEEANRRVLDAAAQRSGVWRAWAPRWWRRWRSAMSCRSPAWATAALICWTHGGFRAITEDQSWVNEVGRPLGLNEEILRTHPMRHVLTMAIGAGAPLEINYYTMPLVHRAICC